MVTFGVVPTFPATGYGYVKGSSTEEKGLMQLESFVEKPDLKTAEDILQPAFITGTAECLFSKHPFSLMN